MLMPQRDDTMSADVKICGYLDKLGRVKIKLNNRSLENSIRDTCTPLPGEIVFITIICISSETVQTLGYVHSSQLYKGPNNV